MKYVRGAVVALIALFLLGMVGCSSNAPDEEPTVEELADQAAKIARSKLVCIQNDSREPIRVKLYDSDTGHRFRSISMAGLGDARVWVDRRHFNGHTTVGVDPTGGDETYPDALHRLLTNENGYPLALEIGALRGGNEPFAHSARLAECP